MHYQKVVIAPKETIRLTEGIDKVIPVNRWNEDMRPGPTCVDFHYVNSSSQASFFIMSTMSESPGPEDLLLLLDLGFSANRMHPEAQFSWRLVLQRALISKRLALCKVKCISRSYKSSSLGILG
jgi:hypothetical protein